jgi:hypothetical protein
MGDPLKGYQPRSWSTYNIDPEEGANLPTKKAEGFVETSAESSMAQGLADLESYDPGVMFFFDFEQMAAGHTAHGNASLLELTEPYMGHPTGRLAFVTYEGMADEPRHFTLYIEN